MLQIFSYNVNGIRAAVTKGFIDWLKESNPDIIGLQEIKANAEDFPKNEIEALGYHVYTFSAEKKGYSGVAILSKNAPKSVEIGCGNPFYDCEGRVLIAHYDGFSVINTYFPSGSSGDVRQEIILHIKKSIFTTQKVIKKALDSYLKSALGWIDGLLQECEIALDFAIPSKKIFIVGGRIARVRVLKIKVGVLITSQLATLWQVH
jgi:exodeoxyribonuclease-3